MASLKENVLASGFVAMTEDELYSVNGGRGRSGNSGSSSGKSGSSTPTSTPIAVPSGAGKSGGSGKNGGNTSESGGKNGGGKGSAPTFVGGTMYDSTGTPAGVKTGISIPIGGKK